MLRLLLASCFIPALAVGGAAQTKLLRFPDIHGDRVAFCYAGDLWVAPSNGGTATRLTAHAGLELFPKFSPDGAWIAFTGQYDGDEQVYAMPSNGGVPKQLTWYPARGPLPQRWGYDNQVYGWSRDGKGVLFRSMRDGWDLTDTRLYTVDLEGSLPVALPMPVSGGGDFSPGGTQAVYSPLTRDFRTWKRYEGGWAQDLYIYDFKSAKIEPVAHSKRTERDPMWIGNRIYFVSDRDGTLNLFEFDVESKRVEQLTQSSTWDVRWASRGEDGEIVYEQNGELSVYDTKTRANRSISIRVPDDGLASRPSRVAADDSIESIDLAPKGERALVVAHGDVFTLPIEKGSPRNLSNTAGAHDREARWSPDGARVAFVSDKSGEEEIWIVAQDGSASPEQLTSGSTERKTGIAWSPDSKKISYTDKSGRLWVVDIASKVATEAARDRGGNLGDSTWSPDSRWIAMSLQDANGYRSIWLCNVAKNELTRVTDEMWNESEPVWHPDGDYLYYLSDREWAPQLNLLEWNFSPDRTTLAYALALRRDVKHPFPPESDEVGVEKDDEKKDDAKEEDEKKENAKTDDEKKDEKDAKKDDAKKKSPPKDIEIDLEGLSSRVAAVPLEADNYGSLTCNKEALFVIKRGPAYYGRTPSIELQLVAFSFKDRKTTTILEKCNGYQLSADGSKILARVDGGLALLDASSKGKDSKKSVATNTLFVERTPKDEWRNVFAEVWRRYRDYFYAPNMHGYDWAALRRQYEPLLEHVGHRADLNYVLGEMVAELNVGHAYVSGGEWEKPERPRVALFGGRLELDEKAGRYRLAKILRGHNEESKYRSPLTEIGVDVKVGDYVLAIDGVDLPAKENPYRLLRHKADRPVSWLVNDKPSKDGARTITYRPITTETELFYFEYVARNRARVDEMSGGKIGYIHIPDMGADGIAEFSKWYYGQVRKEGLIVDDRNNGGGNVSQMILERLRRTLLGTGYSRNSEFVDTYPQVVFNGPMACLLNENSASDGDIFPWMFKTAKVGPLIGKRSWGGVVGITDRGPLLGGGTVNVPEFGHADARGQWAVEGYGVDPDIVVENDPASILAGRDPQLERAVEEVTKAMALRSSVLPARPSDPVKTK